MTRGHRRRRHPRQGKGAGGYSQEFSGQPYGGGEGYGTPQPRYEEGPRYGSGEEQGYGSGQQQPYGGNQQGYGGGQGGDYAPEDAPGGGSGYGDREPGAAPENPYSARPRGYPRGRSEYDDESARESGRGPSAYSEMAPPGGGPQSPERGGDGGQGARFDEGIDMTSHAARREGRGGSPYGAPQPPMGGRTHDPRDSEARPGESRFVDYGSGDYGGTPFPGGYGSAQADPGAPRGEFGAPRGDYGAPRGEYGAPRGNYGGPRGGPGGPRGGYGGPPGAGAPPEAREFEPRYARGRHPRGGPRGGDRFADPRFGDPRFGRGPIAHSADETVEGIFEGQKDGSGMLRFMRNSMLPSPEDVFVSQQVARRFFLRDGSLIEGPLAPPMRPGHKASLREVTKVDGMTPEEAAKLPRFGELTVIDPDFHYELGDNGDISLRVLDLLCPVGRGQRGLIVAPPRTGKTIFLHKVAQAMEQLYPDVHLMVLLVDERPEEGTGWKRLVKGDVFLSTLDEGTRHHVQLAEAAFRRAMRLVECKKDVMLLLDSITRMSRAYNAEIGNSGRILTGGVDSRTMEKPKRLFGAARNTEQGGALTILGTALVDTGSRMDQVIFEEFKGTGNMELVLSRTLADRRIFPAFDIGLSGTRKEEKLISPAKLKRIVTLRRVIQKMKPIEAMEQLLRKLERTPNNEEFLRNFELDGAGA